MDHELVESGKSTGVNNKLLMTKYQFAVPVSGSLCIDLLSHVDVFLGHS